MSDTTKTRIRNPWWIVGSDLVTAPIVTAFFGFMAFSATQRLAQDPVWWDMLYLAGLLVVIGAGIASIVFFVRHPELRRNPFSNSR